MADLPWGILCLLLLLLSGMTGCGAIQVRDRTPQPSITPTTATPTSTRIQSSTVVPNPPSSPSTIRTPVTNTATSATERKSQNPTPITNPVTPPPSGTITPSVTPTLIPQIGPIHISGTGKDMKITINGQGFGPSPVQMPYTGDLRLFCFFNAKRKWSAGYNGGPDPETSVTIIYGSWNDNLIEINGFSGDYGMSGFTNEIGDEVGVAIQNYGSPGFSTQKTWTYGVDFLIN